MRVIEQEILSPSRLLLGEAKASNRSISIAFAPFDHLNRDADLVIVGLTPGKTQMRAALLEARRLLRLGVAIEDVAPAVKAHASFAGPLRGNLVAMLDHIGLATHFGLRSTASFWTTERNRVQFASALHYPVFVDGNNYSGNPDLLATPLLTESLRRWFGSELASLRNALIVPLGPKVAGAVEAVAREIDFDTRRVLAGLPHPSGANAERIQFFLERKPRERLSSKVNPASIVAARTSLITRVTSLGGE